MNPTEKFIIDSHCKNIDIKYEAFAKRIMAEQSPNVFSIIYATDVHYIRKYALFVAAYYKLKEMVEFSGKIGADLLAITGDLVDGNTTIDNQYRDLYDFISLVKESKSTSVAVSKGNHDDCSWYAYLHKLDSSAWISEEQWYNHVINPIRVQYPIVLDPENPVGGYYYIDYPFHKIRVININTNDMENRVNADGIMDDEKYCGQWCLAVREKQLKWLKKALTFGEADWSVIFMSHDAPIHYLNKEKAFHNSDALMEIICAFKNKKKGHIKNTERFFETDMEYDFSNNKSNDVLPYLFGHCHEDMVIEKDGIYFVSSRNILNASSAKWDDKETEIKGGWDVILIDKNKRTFKSRRFENPKYDREFNF